MSKLYKIYSIQLLSIIGEFNGEWYPLINNFKLPKESIKPEIFQYDNSYFFINKSYKLSQKFLDLFATSQEKLKNDFRSIGNLIIQDSLFNKIGEIIDKFPDKIKTQLISDIKVMPISSESKTKYNYSKNPKIN
jgi:hypothetical protein